MPTLVKNHQRAELQIALKKAYSAANQAVNLMVAQEGWDSIASMTKYYVTADGTNDTGNPCNYTSTNSINGVGCNWYAVYDISPENSKKSYWKDYLR